MASPGRGWPVVGSSASIFEDGEDNSIDRFGAVGSRNKKKNK